MAGGTWISQNKKQPGVYINVKSKIGKSTRIGERGVVAICEPLSWGPESTLMTINAGDSYVPMTGYDETHRRTLFLREIFKGSDRTAGAAKVLLYRPQAAGAAKASGMTGPLTVTARYTGVRGNDISVSVAADPDREGTYTIETYVDGVVRDTQNAKTIADLHDNDWGVFFGTGNLETGAGITLTGGTDGTVGSAAYADFLVALEPYDFNILIYDGEDGVVRSAYASFAIRMRNDLGKKCQAVMSGAESDSDAVISVRNGVMLGDGTAIPASHATWWVGGAEAGADYRESLVYAQYPGAVDTVPRLSSADIDDALDRGQIVFFEEFGSAKIVSDINTLVSHTPEHDEVFSFNQVIRILDTAANDIYRNFSMNYIGKIQNHVDGQLLLKAWIVGYLNEMQANGGIQNFEAGDVTVESGGAVNSVVIEVAIQPVLAVEKIYITVSLTDE